MAKHYYYIQNLTMEDFLDGEIEWDVFRIPLDYKEKLQAINPPLNEAELQKEIDSDAKIKRHYYSYDDPNAELPINSEIDNKVDRKFVKVNNQVFDTLRKYDSLESYDFYNEREEKEKDESKQKEKYIWGSKKNLEKQQSVEDIKKKILSQKKNKNS